MDAASILGIKSAPKTQNDLEKLRRRAKELHNYYKKKNKPQEVKKVDWAWNEFKKKMVKKVQGPEGPPMAGDGDEGPSPEASPEEEASQRSPPASREEAIREKLAARRAQGKEPSEADRRREQIRNNLAVKRALKQVPTIEEEEAKKGVMEILATASKAGDKEALRLQMACPLSAQRIRMPARGRSCQHVQTFDLEAFLTAKCTFCPVCRAPIAEPSQLYVDSFIAKVIKSTGEDVPAVHFDASTGVWTACAPEDDDASAESMTPLPESPAMEEEAEGNGDVKQRRTAAKSAPAPGSGATKRQREEEDGEAAAESAAKRAKADKVASAAAAKEAEIRRKAKEEAAKIRAAQRAKEKEAERAAAAKKAEEEAKFKALLKFIPQGRPDAKKTGVAPSRSKEAADGSTETPLVDVTDEHNYVVVQLPRPMGIVFSANAPPTKGVCIQSFDADGAAAVHGRLREGDQVVAVGRVCVLGHDVDLVIDGVVADPSTLVTLTVFRGKAQDLYGPQGVSTEWIEGLLDRVREGKLKPSPPLERHKKKKKPSVVANALSDGEQSSAGEDFSEDEEHSRKSS